MNDKEQERKLRAARSALTVSGRGLLALSFWNVIKTVLTFWYSQDWEEARRLVTQGTLPERITASVFLILLLGVYLLIYIYVGSHAMAEGRGEDRGSRYLVIDALLTVILFLKTVGICVLWLMGNATVMNLSEVPVEAITFAAAADLFVNAMRVRHYAHRQRNEEGGAACS